MATFLEDYIERIASFPQELKRDFDVMRRLDEKSQEEMITLRRRQDQYLELLKQGKSKSKKVNEEKEKALQEIEHLRDAVTQKAEEKVAVANQVYEILDKHIQRLDKDLKSFETKLKARGEYEEADLKLLEEPMLAAPQPAWPGKKQAGKAAEKRERKKKKKDRNAYQTYVADDTPYEPNEPLYCTCQRVAFGDMVGCDNEDCEIEWFHFECVGLKDMPKGKWYCPDCRAKMASRKRQKTGQNRVWV